MTTALILFRLPLTPLYNAIAQVESGRGATSANVYQIRSIYIQDVNRIYDLKRGMEYHSRDALDRDKSEMMMFLYWKYWGYQYARQTKCPVTYEVLARIHNGGPAGYSKVATLNYWHRVRKELVKQGVNPYAEAKEEVR